LADSLDGQGQTTLGNLLTVIEATFPVEDAYNRLGTDHTHAPEVIEKERIAELARVFQAAMVVDVETLAQRLALVEPFNGVPDLKSFLKENLGD
jgi:hypothetical protein